MKIFFKYAATATATPWTLSTLTAAVTALKSAADRTTSTRYDRLNRAVRVTQPQAFIFDQNGLDGAPYQGNAARTTAMTSACGTPSSGSVGD